MNVITVAEIKRSGFAALDAALAQGPVHLMKHNRPSAVRLFLGACALIYRLEGAAPFRTAAIDTLAQLCAQHPSVELMVSRLSVLACRVKPLHEGDAMLLKRYDDFFASVHIVELGAKVVDAAIQLRARYGLTTPDALQAASAFVASDRALFVTADAGFTKVTGLDVRLIRPSQPLPTP